MPTLPLPRGYGGVEDDVTYMLGVGRERGPYPPLCKRSNNKKTTATLHPVDVSTQVSVFSRATRFDESTLDEQREGGEESYLSAKGPNTCTKEAYVSAAEPYISTDEHCISTTSTQVIRAWYTSSKGSVKRPVSHAYDREVHRTYECGMSYL